MHKNRSIPMMLTIVLTLTLFLGNAIVKADTSTTNHIGVTYQGYVQNIGWHNWVSDGQEVGTDGQGLRVEALRMKLTGTLPIGASIQYRGHLQNIGWQDWVSDGEESGTDGQSLRIEALEIRIVKTSTTSIPVPIPVPIPDSADITSKFTDKNFENKVYSLIGKASSSPILYSDVKNIKTLDMSGGNISSLNGIEYFTALTGLECYNNGLTTLDVNKNTALTNLGCASNKLTILDVSKNTALSSLYCAFNKLTTLDVSKNTVLSSLYCVYNNLTSLYSIKDTWNNEDYKTQYTDSTHTTTKDNLTITIKK